MNKIKVAATVLALASACVLAGCGGPGVETRLPSDPTRTPYAVKPDLSRNAVLLDFDEEDPIAVQASGKVGTRSLQAGGGQLIQVPSGNGTSALQFPSYDRGKNGPRLVLVLESGGGPDQFNPAGGEFSFGADLRLDAESSEKGSDDNGDNVLQRGLFSDQFQYKLQVDKRVPSCTVKSGATRMFVKLDQSFDDNWFRVRCDYRSGTLTISASRILQDRFDDLGLKSVQGTIKPLQFSAKSPVTVGGKTTPEGELVFNESDQFNGDLDNVYVDIPRSAG